MRRWRHVAAISALEIALATSSAAQSPASRSFDVRHYAVEIEPNLAASTLRGTARIDIEFTDPANRLIVLDIGALVVDFVREAGHVRDFNQADRRLTVDLSPPGRRGQRRTTLEIGYHGAPKFGLQFVPEKTQIYTIFSTSQWMPCVDVPSDRATLDLAVTLPSDLDFVASGRGLSRTTVSSDRVRHRWALEREAPTFTFGFAAGRFRRAASKAGATRLDFLSTELSESELARVFDLTPKMVAFFEERSGVRYPVKGYAQALVHQTVGQEMSGFSVMSDEYAREVLANPRRAGLIAHELAHQWWGVGITCEDWTHFWLNEGFATFMAAAFREAQFGRDVYLEDVEAWRARYARVRSNGADKSLVFPSWNRPTSDDRALVYQKGALALHELRERLGERVFWKGLRDYTRRHFGKSVVTSDFQRSMEKAAGRSLAGFFDEWIHLKGETR
jgi:aminopeptidase N